MAQPGTTFEKGHIYHSQLCRESPVRLQFTGAVKHRAKELTTFYFCIEGDAEGEYGVKAENDEYEAILSAAPRKVWMTAHFEGNAKDGEATVRLEDAEAAPRPVAQSGGRGAPRAADQPRVGIPWRSMEERYGEALRAAERIVTGSAFLAPDDVRTIAATLCIGQEGIFRQLNAWIPLERVAAEDTDTVSTRPPAHEANPNDATSAEVAGLVAAYEAIKFHVPAKERSGLEKMLAGVPSMDRVIQATQYLAGVAEDVKQAELAAIESASAPPPAKQPEQPAGPDQPSMALASEDDLPF